MCCVNTTLLWLSCTQAFRRLRRGCRGQFICELAMRPLKLSHECNERLDRMNGHRVVERHTHPAHSSMPGHADDVCQRSCRGEFLLDRLVASRDAEHHIHI